MKKITFGLFLGTILVGCSGPKYTATPISESNQSAEVTIVEHPPTRSVFLDNMLRWCMDEGKKCKVMKPNTTPDPSELTLTYISRWSWDIRTFVADAKIKAYRNDTQVGEVEFKAPNHLKLSKYGDDNKRIRAMMDILFGRITVSEAQQKLSAGEY
ncbi:Sbal_3080 family lipoprotein [Grimontia sp. NTOU-MAR1]|uniref:Sbal_3080 family lipoprotein n=1 Tax=Grimontia sp. NTOU-MAR1 TaxID=3111011 RepID=UPI002DBA15DC|nr:Sbal_3080 family lipoprotein [Grimontia sp. NTOU-MAR1]WRW00501.1 Sbal_3080 family lipoprotein [Grimontia sp. NTOU-MAR1]